MPATTGANQILTVAGALGHADHQQGPGHHSPGDPRAVRPVAPHPGALPCGGRPDADREGACSRLPGSEGLQRLRRARLRTRLSTDELLALSRGEEQP